jgi:hypothetical protein
MEPADTFVLPTVVSLLLLINHQHLIIESLPIKSQIADSLNTAEVLVTLGLRSPSAAFCRPLEAGAFYHNYVLHKPPSLHLQPPDF